MSVYCKSRIFRTLSIFVSWALQRFVRMKFSYSRWPMHMLWLAEYLSHAFYFRTEAAAYEIYRPYFSKPRKYRRLFSEPTYWPRRSRGQYGEGNNQAGIFEAEGNKSLIPERLARWPLTCPSTRKVRDESVVSLCSERYNASTGSPSPTGPKWFDRLFSTCIRQLADSPGG